VLEGIEAARTVPALRDIKLNTVAMRGFNDAELAGDLRLRLGARAGAPVHRADADGGAARCSFPAR
jgi:molybdenum cofactor biosynthesis enzyme MoaA